MSARNQQRFPSTLSLVTGVVYLFLYAPIIVLVILVVYARSGPTSILTVTG